MKDKFIYLTLLIVVIIFSGCIQSDTANINRLSSDINSNIKNGDNYFNNAASDLNKYSYSSASFNCNNALSKFNSAKASAQQGISYAQNSKDSVLINYMQLTLNEIDARINATMEIQQAINYLQKNDTLSGNPHVTNANEFMESSMGFKSQKDNIVNQNPAKFK